MELGVLEEVEVPLLVVLTVCGLLSEDVLVVLGVAKLLGVFEGLEPYVIEEVGESEIDSLNEIVDEGD